MGKLDVNHLHARRGRVGELVPDQLQTIGKIPEELRKKIFITLLFLCVYRVGYYVPLPMIDQQKLADKMQSRSNWERLRQVLGFVSRSSLAVT